MTITLSGITNGKRTLTWTKTGSSEIVVDILTDCVHRYWSYGNGRHVDSEGNPIAFDDLTNNEKYRLLDDLLLFTVKRMAVDYNIVESADGIEATRAAKELQNQTKYELDKD